MSENSVDPDREAEEQEDAPRNPFDNPLFLPVLLLALALWFGYDGWINQDAHMLEHRTFNQVGFAILVIGVVWSAYRARQEMRLRADQKASSDPDA
jgi:hypothetical protein